MNDFFKCLLGIATFLWIGTGVLLLTVAALLIFAPDILLKLMRYTAALVCAGIAVSIFVPLIAMYLKRTRHH